MTEEGDLIKNTNPHDWVYHAQGGANILLAHSSHNSAAEFDGKLLRVRKVNAHRTSAELSQPEEDSLELGFGREVVGQLLGANSVLPIQSYPIKSDWLVDLRESLSRSQAALADRAAPAEVNITATTVQLTDNLTHGNNTLAIEIKPKWGFLPPPPPPSSQSGHVNLPSACRFCKHSALRRSGLPRAASFAAHQAGYCPLDLYSQDHARVARAVHALVAAWRESGGQQNNLRVFWRGHRVVPDDAATLEAIEHALDSTRLAGSSHSPEIENTRAMKAHITSSLLASPLLARLRHLQSSFAPVTASQLRARLPSSLPPQPTLAAWKQFLDEHTAFPLHPNASVEALVLGHSLSATFKDCSIFLRATGDGPAETWETEIKAIDLDPKPLGKIHKWAELERDIDEAWERDSRAWREAGWEVRECYE